MNQLRAIGQTCDRWHRECSEDRLQRPLVASSHAVQLASSSTPRALQVSRLFSVRRSGRQVRGSLVSMAVKCELGIKF